MHGSHTSSAPPGRVPESRCSGGENLRSPPPEKTPESAPFQCAAALSNRQPASPRAREYPPAALPPSIDYCPTYPKTRHRSRTPPSWRECAAHETPDDATLHEWPDPATDPSTPRDRAATPAGSKR